MKQVTSGIYILFYETDDFQYYIGKSINIENRYNEHCSLLKNGTHYNIDLIKGYETHGMPSLNILEVLPCDDNILYLREIEWIKEFDSFKNGMNRSPGGEGCGFGEEHPSSLYSNKLIKDLVIYILKNPNNPLTDVSKELKISISVIRTITNGRSHTWLAREIPTEYSKLLMLNGTRNHSIGIGEKCPNSICSDIQAESVLRLLSKGTSCIEVSNITLVSIDTVRHIYNSTSHKWLRLKFPIEYALMLELKANKKLEVKWPPIKSPDGKVYYVSSQIDFAKSIGLPATSIGRVLNGTRKSYLGWVLASNADTSCKNIDLIV